MEAIHRKIANVSFEKALRQALPCVIAAAGLANDVRARLLDAMRVGKEASVDEPVQAWVVAELLSSGSVDAGFYTQTPLSALYSLFPADARFVWMLGPTDGPHYRGKSKKYDVRLILYDQTSRQIEGAIIARPEQNDALIAWRQKVIQMTTDPKACSKQETGLNFNRLTTTSSVVLIPKSFASVAKVITEAGFTPIMDPFQGNPDHENPYASLDLFTGRISGVLSVNAPICSTGADGFLVKCAGGEWLQGPHSDPYTLSWSIAAANWQTAKALRAAVSAQEIVKAKV